MQRQALIGLRNRFSGTDKAGEALMSLQETIQIIVSYIDTHTELIKLLIADV
jgi:hypothetical protein